MSAGAAGRVPVLRFWAAVLLCGGLFVLTRVFLIFHPQDAGWMPLVDEMSTGNIAWGLDTGLVMPIPLYQTKPFAPGTLFEGLLSIPFRALVGPNLLALKLAAVAWNLAALVMWMALAWRFFGPGPGLGVGMLWAIAPPFFALMTITAWGNHCESALATGAALYLLLGALSREGRPMRDVWVAGAGVVAGFGLFLTPTGLFAPAVALATIFASGAARRARMTGVFLGGVLFGYAPILWVASAYRGFGALLRIDTFTGYAEGQIVSATRLFLEERLLAPFAKFALFWIRDFWVSGLYAPRGIFGVPIAALAALVFAGALAAFVYPSRRHLARAIRRPRQIAPPQTAFERARLAVLLAPVIYSLIYAASGFRLLTFPRPDPGDYMGYRYLVPAYPFAFLAVTAGLAALWNAPRAQMQWRVGARAAVAAAVGLFAGVFGSYYLQAARGEPEFAAIRYRGENREQLAFHIAAQASFEDSSVGTSIDRVANTPAVLVPYLFERMPAISDAGFRRGSMIDSRHPADLAPMLARGLGEAAANGLFSGRLDDAFARDLTTFMREAGVAEKDTQAYFEGAGRIVGHRADGERNHLVATIRAWDDFKSPWIYAMIRGIGRPEGEGFAFHERVLKMSDPAYLAGAGAELRRTVEMRCRTFDAAARMLLPLNERIRSRVLAGFVAEGREYFGDGNEAS
ncbi:hypothetical protein K8I61_15760 [bacterium]|nr:hypothetical protein [bacterium]